MIPMILYDTYDTYDTYDIYDTYDTYDIICPGTKTKATGI